MVRNIGGIANPNLYTKCFFGTKILIEQYIDKVVEHLHWIFMADDQTAVTRDRERWKQEPQKDCSLMPSSLPFTGNFRIQHDYLVESLQSFGRSALILTGGLSLGNSSMPFTSCPPSHL